MSKKLHLSQASAICISTQAPIIPTLNVEASLDQYFLGCLGILLEISDTGISKKTSRLMGSLIPQEKHTQRKQYGLSFSSSREGVSEGGIPRYISHFLEAFVFLLELHPQLLGESRKSESNKPYLELIKQLKKPPQSACEDPSLIVPIKRKHFFSLVSGFQTRTMKINALVMHHINIHDTFAGAGVNIEALPTDIVSSTTGKIMDHPCIYKQIKADGSERTIIADLDFKKADKNTVICHKIMQQKEDCIRKFHRYGAQGLNQYMKALQESRREGSPEPLFRLGVWAIDQKKWRLADGCFTVAENSYNHNQNREQFLKCVRYRAQIDKHAAQQQFSLFDQALSRMDVCIETLNSITPKPTTDIESATELKAEIESCKEATEHYIAANKLFRKEQYKGALSKYIEASEKHPERANPRTLSSIFYSLGSCYARLGMHALAVTNTNIAFNMRQAAFGKTHELTIKARIKLSTLKSQGSAASGSKQASP